VLWLPEAVGCCVVVVVVDWSCAIIATDMAVAIAITRNRERMCDAPEVDLDERAAQLVARNGMPIWRRRLDGAMRQNA
jgi:hypothetical protein